MAYEKCLLTPDCSRADAAFFPSPDPTHYHEYIYYRMTTPHQPSQEAQDLKLSLPWSNLYEVRNISAGNGFSNN